MGEKVFQDIVTEDILTADDSNGVATAANPSLQSLIPLEVIQLELSWTLATTDDPDQEAPHAAGTNPVEANPVEANPVDSYPSKLRIEPPQTERIQELEQALDQCQIFIDELKSQLVQQQFLEDILAQTEEAARVQQQAIVSLKQQLAQQATIELKHLELQQEKQELEQTLAATETLLQERQVTLSALESQQSQDQAQLQHLQTLLAQRQTELSQAQDQTRQQTEEISSLKAQTARLSFTLQDEQHTIEDLEMRLQRTKEVITAQQGIITALQQSQGSDSEKNQVIQGLSKTLLTTQTKLAALEAECANQRRLQAQFQHYSQELESQSLSDQKRIGQLEQQVAEMQEQILHQAQQAREYETAVQHWKDRYLDSEQTASHLKSVLEQLLKDRHLCELILTPQGVVSAERIMAGVSPESVKLLKGLKLDLPAFLALRRSSK